MTGYAETLAQLRATRIEDRRDEILTERVALEQAHRDARQRALDLAALNDVDSAKWADAQMADIESQIAQIDAELDRFDRAVAPSDGLLESERQYIAENPEIASQPGVDKVAGWYANYAVNHLGLARGSPEYIEALRVVLEPQGYEKPWTPDDVCEALGLEPDEYNRQRDKLDAIKRASPDSYPDRG